MKFVKFKRIAEPRNHFFVDSIHLSATRGRQSCFVMPPIGLCVFPRSRKVMQSRSLACRSEIFTDWGVEVWELRLWNKYFSHCSCAVGIHFCFSGVSNFFFYKLAVTELPVDFGVDQWIFHQNESKIRDREAARRWWIFGKQRLRQKRF